ncbi:nucleotidyltransferase family protein, partial [bacterium]|nr:nucleotidyltransferase family protein [bacterium]
MRPELQLILASAKLHTSPPAPLPNERVAREEDLKAINGLIPEVKDWEAFTHLLINNTTAPLLYSKLKQCKNAQLLPAASLALLRKAYYTTFSRSTLMYAEFGQVVQLFQENNIRFIALKGIYLCDWLYGDLGLRQMSDIDLLVDLHDAERCMELLRTRGYEQHPNKGLSEFVDVIERSRLTDIIHYESFHLRDISIEIHIKLTSNKERFTIDIPSLFRAAVPVEVNGMHIHALHPYDLLIHLTTHTDKHFKIGHVQLTSFSDLVNLLFKIERTKNKEQRQEEEQRAKNKEQRLEEEDVWGEGFSWEGLIARSKEFNCEEVVFTYLVLMHRFYKAPLP